MAERVSQVTYSPVLPYRKTLKLTEQTGNEVLLTEYDHSDQTASRRFASP